MGEFGRFGCAQNLHKSFHVPQRRAKIVRHRIAERLQFLIGSLEFARSFRHALLKIGVQPPDFRFGQFALRDVMQNHLRRAFPFKCQRRRRHLHVHDRAIQPNNPVFQYRHRFLLIHQLPHPIARKRPVLGMHEVKRAAADQLLRGRRAEQLHTGGVDEHDLLTDLHKKGVWRDLDQATIPFLAGEKRLFRAPPLRPEFRLAQRAVDGRRQCCEVMLENKVRRAALERLDRHLFPQRSSHENKRRLGMLLSRQGQRGEPIERRQSVVRKNNVRLEPIERFDERGFALNTLE